MTAQGLPLEKMLARLPKSKIRYAASVLDPPLAAAHFGYRYFHEWMDLTRDEQAFLIAAYRTERGMASYQAHEASRHGR